MSLKPVKKSDLGKTWMNPRKGKRILIQPEYHLIVTEGTKTEPNYFKALQDNIHEKYKNRIRLEIHGEGNNTISLFDRAIQIVRNSGITYKHVWIVYDVDDFPADKINKTKELCNNITEELSKKSENNDVETFYHALWSNECIELWFLLHFDYLESNLHRSEYYPKLTKCLLKIGQNEYKKNRNDIFTVLLPYLTTAIKNAKRLANINEGKTPANSNPGTTVYELLEKLEPYITYPSDKIKKE